MAEKDFSVYELYSVYGKMLTETQARAVEDYFGLDLSLGEIAENRGISRQSVKDALTCAEKQLFNLEKKLKFYDKIKRVHTVVSAAVEDNNRNNNDIASENAVLKNGETRGSVKAFNSILDILEE